MTPRPIAASFRPPHDRDSSSNSRLTDPSAGVALLTCIPAPYYIAAWNHLADLVGHRFAVRFIAASEPRRNWSVPVHEMNFAWQLLSNSSNARALFANLRAGMSMLVFLARFRPAAVICGGYNSLPAWVSFAWCKLFRRRFVLWMESNARDHRRPGKLKEWLKNLMVSKADAIAALGKATVEYVYQLGAREEQIFVAPFGGDGELFFREASKIDSIQEKKLRGYPPRLILYSGRLVREKGVFVLLDAFRVISPMFADLGLLIVGHGPEQKAMEDFCRKANLKQVYFEGPQEYRRMPLLLCLGGRAGPSHLQRPLGLCRE